MADISASDRLNSLLLFKPNVMINGTRKVTVMIRMPIPFLGEILVPTEVDEPYQYPGPARVINTRVVEVKGLQFDTARITELPSTGLLTKKTVHNCANTTVTSSIGLSISGTQSWSISKTNTVATTTGASVTASMGVPGVAGGSMTLSFSQAITTSAQTQDGGSQQVSRTSNETISIGPKQAVSIELFAYQGAAEVPFSAQVVVDGDLEANVTGIKLASELLGVEERTFPFDGVLRLSDVSQANLRTRDLGGADSCGVTEGLRIVAETLPPFPADSVGSHLTNGFGNASALTRSENGAIVTKLGNFATFSWNAAEDGPSIGVPDGTHYEILYTTQVYEPSVACGFNDISVPNLGIFSIEARQYRTYNNGQLVSQWQENVKTFISCHQV